MTARAFLSPSGSISALAAALALVGCTTVDDGAYPDLGKRAVEGTLSTVAPEPVPLPPPPPPTADLAARIAQLGAQADAGEAAFRAAFDRTARAIAAANGAAVSSDAWVAAQVALSVAEADRGPSVAALADCDRLIVTREDAGTRDGADALAALQARLSAMVTAQDAALGALAARLRPA